ncbi:MAG: AAA family ATPase [Corynebacterium sp.]|nr:AAA family ATPase [Corynebacterium sp.]
MAATNTPLFPFAAVVGQEQLQLALILCAINPQIGGVIIQGEKGTAKTTTVRAFADLLGDAAFVNLPLGATEDRVIGSLDVETVLTTGRATFRPGLLSQADGGVLYVDEVNLLSDHLVDSLLDAAATGQVTVERDGISHSAPARFVLVGTMNPEEGELRPQLLDRFGLAVEVAASKDVAVRAEIVQRRLAYEANPAAFFAQWQQEDASIAAQIIVAQQLHAEVQLDAVILQRIASICAAFDVDGMRADLVIARTARAHAAWQQRREVTDEDIAVAAALALPHRRRRDPFDETGIDDTDLQQALDEAKEQFPDEAPQNEQQPQDPGGEEQDGDDPVEQSSAHEQSPADGPESSNAQANQDGKAGSAQVGAQFRP